MATREVLLGMNYAVSLQLHVGTLKCYSGQWRTSALLSQEFVGPKRERMGINSSALAIYILLSRRS